MDFEYSNVPRVNQPPTWKRHDKARMFDKKRNVQKYIASGSHIMVRGTDACVTEEINNAAATKWFGKFAKGFRTFTNRATFMEHVARL